MKKKNERLEALMRIVVAVVTGVILYIWGWVAGIATILNWLVALIAAKRSQSLAEFCEYWSTESYKLYHYLSGMSNDRPFPFSSMQQLRKFQK